MGNVKEKSNQGITLIALVITIIVLLILAGISIASLTGENGILTKASLADEKTEIEDAKEQAKLDIATYIADRAESGLSTELEDSDIKNILTGKAYVSKEEGQPGNNSFETRKSGYEILYSDLYQSNSNEITFTIDSYQFKAKKGQSLYEWIRENDFWNVTYAGLSEYALYVLQRLSDPNNQYFNEESQLVLAGPALVHFAIVPMSGTLKEDAVEASYILQGGETFKGLAD